MKQQDATLLQHWAMGRDAEAFNEIVTRYLDLVYGTCKRVLGNEADAEDVTQECFIRLAQNPGQVRSSVGGWLHKLATHRSRDLLKAESRRRRREEQFVAKLPQTAEAGWEDIQAFVDEAIEHLPRKQRRVIVAHFLQRKTHEAIARELGVTRPAVSYHIKNGVENLRKFLQNRGIKVSAATLLTASTARMAEAAPADLASRLGKLALATTSNSATTGTTALVGALTINKAIVGLTAILLGVLASWALMSRDTPLPVLTTADSVAGLQEQATIQTTNSPQALSPKEVEPEAASAAQVDDDAMPAIESLPEDTPVDDDADETSGGIIEGLVVDRYGTPIENAAIFLQKYPEQENAYNNTPVAHTAPDGTFRVDGVRLDLIAIFADRPDLSPGWTSMTPDLKTVDTVRITLVPGGAVEGTVTVDGQSAQSNISALSSSFAVIGSVASEPDGSYRLERLTPGIAEVVAFVGRQRNMIATAIVEPGRTTVLDFNFPSVTAILEGRVTMEGAPVPRAVLRLSVYTTADAHETYGASTGPDGFYRIENLPPGEASMAAYSTGKNGSKRRRSVSFDIAPEGVTTQDVDLTVGNCAVSGRIDTACTDCSGVICILNGDVVLEEFTVSALANLDSLMVADAYDIDGTYRFDGLQPGTYTLLVLFYPDDVDSMYDHMGLALVATEVVRLEEGREEVVDLWPLPLQ